MTVRLGDAMLPGAPWRHRLRGAPREMKRFNFEPVIEGRAYAYRSYAEWASIAERRYAEAHRVVESLAGDPDLQAYEVAAAAKLGACWRVVGYGRLLFQEEQYVEGADQARALVPYLKRRFAQYERTVDDPDVAGALAATRAGNRVWIGKAKGSTTFGTGTDRELGLAVARVAHRVGKSGGFRAVLEYFSGRAGGEPVVLGCLKRVQAGNVNKPTDLLFPLGPYLRATGEQATLAKVRVIKHVPLEVNAPRTAECKMIQVHRATVGMRRARPRLAGGAPSGGLMLACLRGTYPLLARGAPEDDLWYSPSLGHLAPSLGLPASAKHVLTWDYKQCDETIGYRSLVALDEHVHGPLAQLYCDRGLLEPWEVQFARDAGEWIRTAPLLMPGRSAIEDAALVPVHGQNRSGDQRTTAITNDIVGAQNDLICDAVYNRLGIRALAFNSGDDSGLVLDRPVTDAILADVQALLNDPAVSNGFVFVVDDVPSYGEMSIRAGVPAVCRRLARRIDRETHEEPICYIDAAYGWANDVRDLAGLWGPHPSAGEYLEMGRRILPRAAPAIELASRADATAIRSLAEAVSSSLAEHMATAIAGREADLDPDTDEWVARLLDKATIRSKAYACDLPARVPEALIADAEPEKDDAVIKRSFSRRKNTTTRRTAIERVEMELRRWRRDTL